MTKRKWAAAGAALTASALLLATPSLASAGRPEPHASPSLATLRAQIRDGSFEKTHRIVDVCAAEGLNCQYTLAMTGPDSHTVLSTSAPAGWGATDLEKAYGLNGAPSADGTITILDAAAYPSLASDLAVYRKTYGLPPCTVKSGCLTIHNFHGGPPMKPPKSAKAKSRAEAIAVETSLDVDMASAACPGCKIVELQLPIGDAYDGTTRHNDRESRDFGTAVITAVRMHTDVVSISYANPVDHYTDFGRPAKALDQPGTAIFSSSGDGGYNGTAGRWPENLRTVISVGGTMLQTSTGKRGFTEVVWPGAGSGCAPDLKPAIGQPKKISAYCNGMRAESDVSAVASGVAVYDTYAPSSGHPHDWMVVGGTSVASPLVASIAARAPSNPAVHGPNLLYKDKASAFHDITSGQNGDASECTGDGFSAKVCVAGRGWDGPSGLGTPKGLKPFTS